MRPSRGPPPRRDAGTSVGALRGAAARRPSAGPAVTAARCAAATNRANSASTAGSQVTTVARGTGTSVLRAEAPRGVGAGRPGDGGGRPGGLRHVTGRGCTLGRATKLRRTVHVAVDRVIGRCVRQWSRRGHSSPSASALTGRASAILSSLPWRGAPASGAAQSRASPDGPSGRLLGRWRRRPLDRARSADVRRGGGGDPDVRRRRRGNGGLHRLQPHLGRAARPAHARDALVRAADDRLRLVGRDRARPVPEGVAAGRHVPGHPAARPRRDDHGRGPDVLDQRGLRPLRDRRGRPRERARDQRPRRIDDHPAARAGAPAAQGRHCAGRRSRPAQGQGGHPELPAGRPPSRARPARRR